MRHHNWIFSLFWITGFVHWGCSPSSIPTAQISTSPLENDGESVGLLGDLGLDPGALSAAAILTVTTIQDSGLGSLRNAVAQASASGTSSLIRFVPEIEQIHLQSPIVYSGSDPLLIDGGSTRVVLDASGVSGDALVANGGGDLTLLRLQIQNASSNGVRVDVPADQTGEIQIGLAAVTLLGQGEFGLLVEDQIENSEAGIVFTLSSSTIGGIDPGEGNGFGLTDRDGIRLNEGGAGTLEVQIVNSQVLGNGGDGVELDETGDGNVVLTTSRSQLNVNGSFDPADPDDGLDLGETGAGSIIVTALNTSFSDNFDQGLDWDEDGPGDIRATLRDIEAIRNQGENIKFSEDGICEDDAIACSAAGGNMTALFTRVNASSSQTEDGIEMQEFGSGDLGVTLTMSNASNNQNQGIHLHTQLGSGTVNAQILNSDANNNSGSGLAVSQEGDGDVVLELEGLSVTNNDQAGMNVVETDAGLLDLSVSGGSASNNREAGIQIQESGAGDFISTFTTTSATNNDGAGFQLEEEDGGHLNAQFTRITANNNNDGLVIEEGGQDSLTAQVLRSTIVGNEDDGIEVTQEDPGNGMLDRFLGTLTLPPGSQGQRIQATDVVVNEFPAP